jgi:hypothetical protein
MNFSAAYITSAALRDIMFHLFSGKPTGETRAMLYIYTDVLVERAEWEPKF